VIRFLLNHVDEVSRPAKRRGLLPEVNRELAARGVRQRPTACAVAAVPQWSYNGGHWPAKPSRSIWMTCLSVSPHLSITILRDSATVISRS
jgi:hypothetical protein